jgi:outer membrane protein OmpA-like peptidoglycan-associated protein
MWATAAAPVVKGVIDKLPEGYVLQVTGHTDARGPEGPVGAKPGNIKISTDRAKAVFDALKAKGVTSPKMTYKGVGSSELIPGVDPKDAQQRRVTFKVVPQK